MTGDRPRRHSGRRKRMTVPSLERSRRTKEPIFETKYSGPKGANQPALALCYGPTCPANVLFSVQASRYAASESRWRRVASQRSA